MIIHTKYDGHITLRQVRKVGRINPGQNMSYKKDGLKMVKKVILYFFYIRTFYKYMGVKMRAFC